MLKNNVLAGLQVPPGVGIREFGGKEADEEERGESAQRGNKPLWRWRGGWLFRLGRRHPGEDFRITSFQQSAFSGQLGLAHRRSLKAYLSLTKTPEGFPQLSCGGIFNFQGAIASRDATAQTAACAGPAGGPS